MSLELFLAVLEIDEEKATQIKERFSEDEFLAYYRELELNLGQESATQVLKEGCFSSYSGSFMDEYLRLVRIVRGKINSQKEQDLSIFNSIESLTKYLNPTAEMTIDVSKLHFFSSPILNPNDSVGKKYLFSLVEKGHITVGTNERWGNRDNGPQGANLLQAIQHQLRLAFCDLGLEAPSYRLNYARLELTIDDTTKSRLAEIRELVYARQIH